MYQLDFRHDGRDFEWDQDRSIRAMCYFMLAYPSTEISQSRSDFGLQKRATMDLPFLVSRFAFPKALDLASGEAQRDVVHYLDGVYTPEEIGQRIGTLYGPLVARSEVSQTIEKLRSAGLVDSFGNPNPKAKDLKRDSFYQMIKKDFPQSSKDIMFFWNGEDMRYIYLPKSVKNMKSSFYHGIPEDAFEFLFFSKRAYSMDDISSKMSHLFGKQEGYHSLDDAVQTTRTIRDIYLDRVFLTTI